MMLQEKRNSIEAVLAYTVVKLILASVIPIRNHNSLGTRVIISRFNLIANNRPVVRE